MKMKKLLALVLVAALAISLVVSASAATTPISDPNWTLTEGTDESMYFINEDGSVAISYHTETVTWANCAILFDASAYGQNYDVSFKAKLPTKVNDAQGNMIQGCIAFAVNASAYWYDGCCAKIIDYSNHPTVGAGTEANLSTCWELFDPGAPATPFSSDEGIVYADAKISATGWNSFKIEVRAGKISLYVNGVKIVTDHAIASTGHMIALGINGDSGSTDVSKMTTYKDFKIAKTDGSKSYTAFGASAAPDTADTLDVVVVASVLVVSLLACAFVMKARKA